jgi:hypothetical protein
VARDYGGTHGNQPWHGAQPPYPGQPPYGPPAPLQPPPYGQVPPPYGPQQYPGQPQHGEPPYNGPSYNGPSFNGPSFNEPSYGEPGKPQPPEDPAALARRHRIRVIAVTGLVLGAIGLVVFGINAWVQMAPRKFTVAQQQQITNWEFGQRWRDLTAGTMFPASVRYPAPEALDDDPALTLSARRVGIAKQASCASAADPTAAAVLDRAGCAAMLRATYVDGTDSYVVTVGAAVLPSANEAATAAKTIAGDVPANGLGPGVRTVAFGGTAAAGFNDSERQLSGVVSAGTYVVLYTVGYTDSRPQEPVAKDGYADGEMTSAGTGVARGVMSKLAGAVPPPHCPGVPGC